MAAGGEGSDSELIVVCCILGYCWNLRSRHLRRSVWARRMSSESPSGGSLKRLSSESDGEDVAAAGILCSKDGLKLVQIVVCGGEQAKR